MCRCRGNIKDRRDDDLILLLARSRGIISARRWPLWGFGADSDGDGGVSAASLISRHYPEYALSDVEAISFGFWPRSASHFYRRRLPPTARCRVIGRLRARSGAVMMTR